MNNIKMNNISNTNKAVELLKVYLNTKGDFRSTKPVAFMDKGLILFTTKVFLDPAILKGNNISVRQVFLNYEVFYNAVRLLNSADYSSYTPAEIQKNNLEVFRKEFLKEKMIIPIGSKKMSIIKSTYVPNSFKPAVVQNIPRNASPYEARFDVTVLDAVRNLKEEDFKRANCKIKASELNKQAKEIFNIDLGLDDEFPPIKRSILTPPNRQNPYGTNPYGYGTNPYGYGSNPSYNNPSYTNPSYNNPSYTNPSYTNPSYTNPSYNNPSYTNELSKVRREISLLLKDIEKEKEKKTKEYYTNEWLNYKDQRLDEGLPVVPMTEWIADRDRKHFVNTYKNEWLKYKEAHNTQPDVDKWRKNKQEEDLVNQSDFLAKKWIDYKSDQIVLGKKPVLLDWLKAEVKKYQKREPFEAEYRGGQKIKRTRTRTRTSKRHKKYKKRSVKGTRRTYTKKRNV